MITLLANATDAVRAVSVGFRGDRMFVELSDGRELGIPYREVSWLAWLATATPEQRASWALEPGGYAIYWDKLDDGVEVCHLLAVENLA
jgi:hypothetical protein